MHHHHFHHCIGRHPGGRGLGRFGRGFVDGSGMGGRPFGMGRKLASVDLQLLILGLIEEKPRHGYEIIKALEERSKGFYVPSPGMVYPALTYLEEIGHATVQADGARKLYSITPEGQEHLANNRGRADALFAQFGRVGERMDRVRRALNPEDAGDEADETAARLQDGSNELRRASKELKLAIFDKTDGSREEQQRIADILKRATAEILGQ